MAINLNIDRYGAQFNEFAAFAAENKNQDWVARMEVKRDGQELLGLDGQPRRIVAKDLDGAGKILRFKASRQVNNDVRSLFLQTILAVCGASSIEELPPSVRAVMKEGDYDGKGRPLTVRRIKAVTQAVKAAADNSIFAAAFATGTSPAVGKIRDLVLSAPCIPANGTQDEKASAFTTKLGQNAAKLITAKATKLVCDHFIQDGKADFTKEHTQFIKDQNRDMTVYIEKRDDKNAVTGEDAMSRDYKTGRDELVRFITGKADDTFANATESVKRQTGILMSFINQYSSTSIVNAFQNTLERPNLLLMMSHSDQCKADTGMTFTLTKSTAGDIQISFGQAVGTNLVQVIDENGQNMYWTDTDTSCCNITVEMTITADSLKNVADADWANADLAAFKADAQADRIPQELRLDMKVSATAHFVLDAGKPPAGTASDGAYTAEAERVGRSGRTQRWRRRRGLGVPGERSARVCRCATVNLRPRFGKPRQSTRVSVPSTHGSASRSPEHPARSAA